MKGCQFSMQIRVSTRISFSFSTIFANLIFFVPFALTLSQILSQVLAIFRQRIILSEKRCSFTDSFNCSNRFKSQYNVKCVGDLKLILALIFKTSAVINLLQCHELIISLCFAYRMLDTKMEHFTWKRKFWKVLYKPINIMLLMYYTVRE